MTETNIASFPQIQDEETKDVGGVAGKRLKAFIERIERLEEKAGGSPFLNLEDERLIATVGARLVVAEPAVCGIGSLPDIEETPSQRVLPDRGVEIDVSPLLRPYGVGVDVVDTERQVGSQLDFLTEARPLGLRIPEIR